MQHLKAITLRKAGVNIILATPSHDPHHAPFASEITGAAVARMAHQTGARPDTNDYLVTVDYHVKQLTAAFGAGA